MDLEALASEFLRALRGRRSQRNFSHRLGYASNVAYAWEAGRRFPTASETLRIAQQTGRDVVEALAGFFIPAPAWLAAADPANPQTITRFLQHLRGDTPIVQLARLADRSRYSVSRWLSGATQPRLPDFLALLDFRALDFLAGFVDPLSLPSAKDEWKQLELRRSLAYAAPYSEAVLLALDLTADCNVHSESWLARKLGIAETDVRATIELLAQAGAIARHDERWRTAGGMAVDTSRNKVGRQVLKRFWAGEALRRIGRADDSLSSYVVFSVSDDTLAELRTLHIEYFERVRRVIGEDRGHPTEVALLNLQLIPLEDSPSKGTDRVFHGRMVPAPKGSRG